MNMKIIVISVLALFITGCGKKYFYEDPIVSQDWFKHPDLPSKEGNPYVRSIKLKKKTDWRGNVKSAWLSIDVGRRYLRPEVFGVKTVPRYKRCGSSGCFAALGIPVVTLPLVPLCYLSCEPMRRGDPIYDYDRDDSIRYVKDYVSGNFSSFTVYAQTDDETVTVKSKSGSVPIRNLLRKFKRKPSSTIWVGVENDENHLFTRISTKEFASLGVTNPAWN